MDLRGAGDVNAAVICRRGAAGTADSKERRKDMRYSAHAVRALLALVVVALGLLTGCNQNPSPTGPYDPQGGVEAGNGSIIADDAWIDAANGVAAGGSAWM
jgi:hypothetical protein